MSAGEYQVVIGTAGHIDHGKTSLVYALTGEETDRLREEKERGMTIDLGFAFLTETITIIDVPGHEKFIRNMVAGIATIDFALLVIAADDGIMPQTIEHVQIMDLLGIRKGVIALTKIDLVQDEEWLDLVEGDIRQTFQATFLKDATIIRISNVSGAGVTELKNELLSLARVARKEQDRGYFRLPVDRVFSKSGFGTVVTGTAISGAIRLNDTIEIMPQLLQAKIRGIQSHGKPVSAGRRGDRLALNLANVEAKEIDRGTEIITPHRGVITERFIAHITLLKDAGWSLKPRQRVHVHIGTAEFLARVWMPTAMKPGDRQNIIFSLEKPMVITHDDRFIIRSYSPMITIGGGSVLWANPGGDWKLFRKNLAHIPLSPALRFGWFVNRFRSTPRTMREWAITWQQSPDIIAQWITELQLLQDDRTGIIYSRDGFDRDCQALLDRVQAFHKEFPYRKWIGRKQLMDDLQYDPKWFSCLVEDCLERQKLVTEESGLRLPDHEIILQDQDKTHLRQILSLITSQGVAMITTREIEADLKLDYKRLQDLLFILKDRGEIIDIDMNLWISSSTFQQLTSTLGSWFEEHRQLSVSGFKELTGLSRKSAIPLLEYLDAHDYTRRIANDREAGERITGE